MISKGLFIRSFEIIREEKIVLKIKAKPFVFQAQKSALATYILGNNMHIFVSY